MTVTDHFHGCPYCPVDRGPDDIYNAGKLHRAACHEHRTTWILGSNLIGSWRHETKAVQRERYRQIESYTVCDDGPFCGLFDRHDEALEAAR